jgi:myo-inositol-1(or 4)-monophosphatase
MSEAIESQAIALTDAQLLDIAVEAAQAGAVLVRRRSADLSHLAWTEKGTADFVTEVDREAESVINDVIVARAPLARTLGEELTPAIDALRGVVFIVDPIDGTTNFLHKYPEYAVSVGVARDGEIVAGAIINVPTAELFTASSGNGAWHNSKRIRVSETTNPGRALIGTGFPFKHPDYLPRYLLQMDRIIRRTAGIRRAGSAALDLADVACGRFDAFWELMLAPWDIAAGIILVREAGGVVTDLSGAPATASHTPVVAGNPALHRWLLGILIDNEPNYLNQTPRTTT